jgi:hypothetical protein
MAAVLWNASHDTARHTISSCFPPSNPAESPFSVLAALNAAANNSIASADELGLGRSTASRKMLSASPQKTH